MKVTLVDSKSEFLTDAYIPYDQDTLPDVLVWGGKIFKLFLRVRVTYRETLYYSVPLATCTELPTAQAETDGIGKYSQLDIRLQVEIVFNHSALCFAVELLTNYLAKDSRAIHEALKDMAVEFVQTQTPEEIRALAAALDRAREKANKSGASSITILLPDFGGES